MLLHTLLTKFSRALLDHAASKFDLAASKTVHKKRTRTLQIAELEAREMLSATPVDWDWDSWWGNFDSNTVQVDPLPSTYNTDSCSEYFGQITIGGNSSQVGATSPFIPDVVSDLAAYNSVTRQGNATITFRAYNPVGRASATRNPFTAKSILGDVSLGRLATQHQYFNFSVGITY